MAKVQITVGPDGSIQRDFLQFVGPGCVEAGQRLQGLLADLGIQGTVTQTTLKPEFFLAPPSSQTVTLPQTVQEGGV